VKNYVVYDKQTGNSISMKTPTDYLKKIGSKGGKNGKGNVKARSPEHYQKMVEERKKKRDKARAKVIVRTAVLFGAAWIERMV